MTIALNSRNSGLKNLNNKFAALILLLVSFVILPATGWAQTQIPSKLIEFWDDREESSPIKVNHSAWQSILDRYLDDQHPSGINRFDYYGVSSVDRQRLQDYLDYLQLLEPRQFNTAEQKAYWINLFNATVVALVIGNGEEVSSIRLIRTSFRRPFPWQREVLEVLTKKLNLDNIQNGIIRPIYKDSRMHYALHKGALGSPNLLKQAFTADNLDALLDKAATEFVNHPRAVSRNGNNIVLSTLYESYADDFSADQGSLISYLSTLLKPELAEQLEQFDQINFAYDWDLNRP